MDCASPLALCSSEHMCSGNHTVCPIGASSCAALTFEDEGEEDQDNNTRQVECGPCRSESSGADSPKQGNWEADPLPLGLFAHPQQRTPATWSRDRCTDALPPRIRVSWWTAESAA
jgi:hypothetical protein